MLRKCYLLVVVLLIPLGLLSRQISWIPVETGDALWAMMVFALLRMFFPTWRLSVVAFAALLISYLDELSQLIQTNWLNSIRATIPGHLILGQGFQYEDLIAYTLGILIFFLVAKSCEVHSGKKTQE